MATFLGALPCCAAHSVGGVGFRFVGQVRIKPMLHVFDTGEIGPWTTVEQERTLTTNFTKFGGSMAMM
jgi:hypothetical protein